MSKYMCLCGVEFKTKAMSDLHLQMWEGHIMIQKKWQARFLDWFFKYNWGRFFRLIGAYLIYLVFICHFDVHWIWWEATLIGIGMGLYIE